MLNDTLIDIEDLIDSYKRENMETEPLILKNIKLG